MNFYDLQIANEAINTKPIKSKKGYTKEFAGVDEKLKAFRMLYPNGGINTTLLTLDETKCVFHAEITDEYGRVLGAGTASKIATNDNSDTFIEACESAAVGRALRFLGIGLECIKNVTPIEDETAKLIELGSLREKIYRYTLKHLTEEQIKKTCDLYNVNSLMDFDLTQCEHYIDFIKNRGGDINE